MIRQESGNKPILIGIADKSLLMRAALKQLFTEDERFKIVSASENSESFLTAVDNIPMDVAVVGWVIPPGDARFILDQLQPRLNSPRGIVYTGLELDLIANDLIIEAIQAAPVACLVSEELEKPFTLKTGAPLFVATDPLDGSSNIDTNLSVGTIFSILPSSKEGNDDCCLLQPGTAQLAAGYAIYGPQTALVLTVGDGTVIFTLDPRTRGFRLTSPATKIRLDTTEFAINSSNSRQWDGHIKAYVDDCLQGEEGPHGSNYNMRWIASLVAECHRILSRGGIFLYPGDIRQGYATGRLRLVYECNPIAFLVEQAGGMASTGTQRIMEIPPKDIHERIPMIFGCV